MTRYAFGKTVTLPFDRARERITEELAKVGFGVLTEIDVQATMKKKLDLDMPPYRILGACNPAFASRALAAEPAIGALLPCNVVVYEETGRTVVAAIDARRMMSVLDNPALASAAGMVRTRLSGPPHWM